MKRYCIGCKELIHPKRLEIIPNTKTCVTCSTTPVKRGVTVLRGNVDKDDTWVDIVFLEQEEYEEYEKSLGRIKKPKKLPKEKIQNYNIDDNIKIVD